LLELTCGLDQPSAGRLAIGGGESAAGRLEQCALMHQRDLLLPWRSALDNATLPLELRGISRGAARARVAPMFDRFGLGEFTAAKPYELSGGMRQRVAFLRTLLAEKPVLLLDEPFGSLDSITRADMQTWLAGALRVEPRTVVLVSHDVEEALFLCDRVLVLSPRPGRLKADLEVSLPRSGPRRETVTSAAFVALKERALEALA
jgi:NitT/TauT family transport system ATP-binding protein